jgi:hypothetical protein
MRQVFVLIVVFATLSFVFCANTMVDKLKGTANVNAKLQTSGATNKLQRTQPVQAARLNAPIRSKRSVPVAKLQNTNTKLQSHGVNLNAGGKATLKASPNQLKTNMLKGGYGYDSYGYDSYGYDSYSYESYCDPYDSYCDSYESYSYCDPYDSYCDSYESDYYSYESYCDPYYDSYCDSYEYYKK